MGAFKRTCAFPGAVSLALLLLLAGCGDLFTGDSGSGRKNYAVVVGIASYQTASLNLKWADEDALDFYDALRRCKNWEADRIRLLTNGAATKDAIKGALALLAKRVSADDQVVFYFSGRGTFWPDMPPFHAGDGFDKFLMPYDSLQGSPARDLSGEELGALFAALPTNNILIVLDTSFGGGGNRGSAAVREKGWVRPGRSAPRGLEGLSRELSRPGYLLLAAAQPGEAAYESDQLRNGVFSASFVEGLRGGANPGRKVVSAQQAFEFAAARTRAGAAGQLPQFVDNRGKPFKVALY